MQTGFCFMQSHTYNNAIIATVYHESFKVEKFRSLRAFLYVREAFYMKLQDGTVVIWI